jgi:TubC N-terminal docking domain
MTALPEHVAALLAELRAREIYLSAEGSTLVIRPASAVTAEEAGVFRRHKAEILALLQHQAPAPVGGTPRTVTTETAEWAASGGRDGRTGLPRGWSPARFEDAALSAFGFANHRTSWEDVAHAIRLGRARVWTWLELTRLEDEGLLERDGDGGAGDPWRFRHLVETVPGQGEGSAPSTAPPVIPQVADPLTAPQLLDRLHREGVRAWVSPRPHTSAPSTEVTPPDGAANAFDWEQA